MIDTEELEREEGSEGQQEPEINLPEHPAGKTQSRQELIDSTLDEAASGAGEESVIDTLAAKAEELTVEDLRKLPGAEGLSDEQIKAEWDKAVAAEKSGAGAEGQQESFKLPFPVYDKEGNKIDALEKISVRDLFEGKLQLGYQALGKEQRKTLAEAIRNASMGHWNEQKYNTTVEERNSIAKEVTQQKAQLEQYANERKVWDAALTALAMGNIEPMKRIAQALVTETTKMPQEIPGYVKIDQVNAERNEREAGDRFIRETINPAVADIAKRYGADPKEVAGAVEFFLRQEPPQFLTQAKIDSILKYDVPNAFEEHGYSASNGPQVSNGNEVAELKKTVEALQSRIAENSNKQTQAARDKTKKAPPSGGGATPGAGDSMPTFKSRSQMKAWMQGDSDWQKA